MLSSDSRGAEPALQKSRKKMTRGCSVKITEDYNLFDVNINGFVGIFLKKTSTSKCLVFVPLVDEWAELTEGQFEKVPGPIPQANLEFVSRVKTLDSPVSV